MEHLLEWEEGGVTQTRKRRDKGNRSGHAHSIGTVCRAHPLTHKPTHTPHIPQMCMHKCRYQCTLGIFLECRVSLRVCAESVSHYWRESPTRGGRIETVRGEWKGKEGEGQREERTL